MDKKQKMFMGLDQYGNTYHSLTHPRKELMERIGSKHADKMYRDNPNGGAFHIGYIIKRLWISLYEVTPMRRSC